MAFVAKLPTWHNSVKFFRKNGNLWAEHTTIVGQVYTPLRNQDDEQGGLLYFMYPLANAGTLRDAFDGQYDVAQIVFPGGINKGYSVREIVPRWLGFPNQHHIACLQRLTANQFNVVIGNADDIDEEGGEGNCELMEDWEDGVFIDNTIDAPLSLTRTSPCFWLSEANKQIPPLIDNHHYTITIGSDDKLLVRLYRSLTTELVGLWIGNVLTGVEEPPLEVTLQWYADIYEGLLPETIDVTY